MTKKQVEEERVYSAYISTLLFITKGSHDRNSYRAETWNNRCICNLGECCLLACFSLFAQLIEPRTTSQEMVLPTEGCTLPYSSQIEKMPYSWISWRYFLIWGSFLCDNSSLCQIDTQNYPVHNPTKIRDKTKQPTLSLSIQYSTWSSFNSN